MRHTIAWFSTTFYIHIYLNLILCKKVFKPFCSPPTPDTNFRSWIIPGVLIFLGGPWGTKENLQSDTQLPSKHDFPAQQNSYCISHLLGLVTTWWLDSDSEVVTVANWRQHCDWAANGSVVTVPVAVNNNDYTVTVQSQCSIVIDGIGKLLCAR